MKFLVTWCNDMITTGIVVSYYGDPKKDTVTYILQIGGRGQGKGE